MDAYEATRVVFSRVQALDPENAAKIMGLLLIQDHGEKEMIRLAFGPETLLQNVVLKARKDLGLQVPQLPVSSSSASSSPATPSAVAPGPTPSPLFLARQNSASRVLHPSPLAVTSPNSWATPPVFSRSNSAVSAALNGSLDDLQCSDELVSPGNPNPSPFYNGAGDLIDELQLQGQLSFLNDQSAGIPSSNYAPSKSAVNDLVYSDNDCRSPSAGVGPDSMLYPYALGWGANGQHRRSFSATDACLASDAAAGLGWKPCLYFSRGFCKNGAACRFVHGLPDETAAAAVAAVTTGSNMDAVVEQQCQEMLLRSKSPRVSGGGMSQLMASAFPYSPTSSLPQSPSASSKCLNFLLQQQQNESQRVAAAAAAAALMLGGDDSHKFMGRSRLERSDFNPGSRQIYLTFPADSTFREEDVSNYFSIYGPVQDVRIPYQQKRMFGFVTFVYPETVKLILAKGNPHFVCDARVLVKPYKEKGKVPDKKQQQQAERGDFSVCTTPTGMDSRDPFDLQHLGARMLYNSSTQELLLRRRLEEQQQALKLQQAIELQGRRFMGLQLLDLKSRNLSSSAPVSINSPTTIMTSSTPTTVASNGSISSSSPEESPPEEKSPIAAAPPPVQKASSYHGFLHQTSVNAADKEESACEDSDFPDGGEHNLPDSPFASPTKLPITFDTFTAGEAERAASIVSATNNNNNSSHLISSTLLPPTSNLDMASLKSCFFQVPRFSGHGAIGM